MKRILYLIPGPMPKKEQLRRQDIANTFVKESQVEVKAVEGPISIESAVEEEMAVSSLLRSLLKIGKSYDAVVLGCFGDPGLRAARELINVPVIGPAEATLSFASMIGDRFGVLTSLERDIPTTRALAIKYEMEHKLVSIRPLNIPVLDLGKNREVTIGRVVEEGKKAEKHDGAEVLILGCMSLAFLLIDESVVNELDIPLLNPAKIGIKTAETFASLKLNHSRKTYPKADYEKLAKSIFREELRNESV